jgi:DNA-binding transcriptional LysR family regulator
MASDPTWDEWRTFREVLREGALSSAARRLKLTQPTVGRHIDALEAALGFALFVRSPRGLAATEAARRLAPQVEAMASASAALGRIAAGVSEPGDGVVRVTASEIIGCEVLPPIFAGFRVDYPRATMELAITNRNEDLLRRDADIAVRMVRPTQSDLVARRIGESRVGLYAHEAYLARCGTPQNLADLAAHKLIGYDRDEHSLRSLGPIARRLGRESLAFRCDSDAAQLAALRAGLGIGGAQENIAGRTPQLIRLLADEISLPLEIWLVVHEDVKSTPLVRALYDRLAEGLADYVAGR